MSDSFFHSFILLFLVTDPVGNIPFFVSVLRQVPPARRWRIVVRECVIAFVLLLLFMLLGKHFLAAIQLSEVSLRIGGGLVLLLISLRMIFPQPGGIMGETSGDHEPFIVPLAIPALAGPSALATVMLFSSGPSAEVSVHITALSAVAVVWLVILLAADRLQAMLGIRVMIAFERLMGLILTAISVEMLLAGLRVYVASFA